LYPKDERNAFNSLYVKSFGRERNRIFNLSLFDMLIFFAKIQLYFELQLNFSREFHFFVCLERFFSLSILSQPRSRPLAHNDPAAWRSGGLHYTSRGARLFNSHGSFMRATAAIAPNRKL
jgi:hypothetical protein